MAEKNQDNSHIPVYKNNAKYALANGEKEQYFASRRENIACKDAIEKTIRDNFDGMYLQCDAKDVIAQFGAERVECVLAHTIQQKNWDGRFSYKNKEWAESIEVPNAEIAFGAAIVESHPAVLDGFINMARKELNAVRAQPKRAAEEKPSIKAQLSAKHEQPEQSNVKPRTKDKGAR